MRTDTGSEAFVATLQRACPAATTLRLRVGAQVMLVKNIDLGAGLCNGARGVVERFSDATSHGFPVVKVRLPPSVHVRTLIARARGSLRTA